MPTAHTAATVVNLNEINKKITIDIKCIFTNCLFSLERVKRAYNGTVIIKISFCSAI